MKAKLKPLKGKYYGTEIIVSDNGIEAHIKIWDSGDYEPSKRELESHGYTEKQWNENELVDNGWGDAKEPIKSLGLICDCHFESKQSYELAIKIMERLNCA